jgi:hypothetical protein
LIPEEQMYFGGMPKYKIKAPIIKVVEKGFPALKMKKKKFDINSFLDKYIEELNPPKIPYYKMMEEKRIEEEVKEKEKQGKLKNLLNIRTFDEI